MLVHVVSHAEAHVLFRFPLLHVAKIADLSLKHFTAGARTRPAESAILIFDLVHQLHGSIGVALIQRLSIVTNQSPMTDFLSRWQNQFVTGRIEKILVQIFVQISFVLIRMRRSTDNGRRFCFDRRFGTFGIFHSRIIVEIDVFPGGVRILIEENFTMAFGGHMTLNRENITKRTLATPETHVINSDFLV